MARDPLYSPSLDLLAPTTRPVPMRDLQRASVDLLTQIDQRQHALMSGWGGCNRCIVLYIAATGAGSNTVTVRCPPGVTEMDFAALMYGSGTLTITTSADATGTALTAHQPTTSVELATWVATGGQVTSTAGANSGRAVTLVSSTSWTWQDVDLTLTWSAVTTAVGIRALELRPVHVPR